MPTLAPRDVIFFESAAELREWLEANHESADELWIGMRRKTSGLPSVTWQEVVDESLCFGWVDSVRKPVDDGYAQRITPRRKGSNWSDRNIGIVEKLRREGRMRPAGEAAFARRDEARQQRLRPLDAESIKAFQADADAWAFWESQPPGYRRLTSGWVMSAVREETRQRRLKQLIEASAAGRRAGPTA